MQSLLTTIDISSRVVRAEPVIVRGAQGFGLKTIAQSMHSHGLIETSWGDGLMGGLGAWRCAEESGVLSDVPLMGEVAEYNEVDCKVMWEIVRYLRRSHS